ncbi:MULTISPECIES: hypothetical protein [Bacteroides]|jgi:hypothetical protein|nr:MULTISPECIES: hypothetical protein [Bacteroides]
MSGEYLPDNSMYYRGKSEPLFLIADLDNIPGEFIRYSIINQSL